MLTSKRRGLLRYLFPRQFLTEYNAGYKDAVDRILLLPAKIRLGNTLELESPASVIDCSIIGAEIGILIRPGAQLEKYIGPEP
jgi:hypothetical protein